MDVYENIVIGSFLYGLGLKMGVGAGGLGSEPTSISLFQQTPLDRPLSDLLFANPRIIRIFEFKRRDNESNKELVKRGLLEDALAGQEMAPLAAISREIHWYVESDYRHEGGQTLAMPYLDFPARSDVQDLTAFIDRLIREAATPANDQKLSLSKEYLNVLLRLALGAKGGSGTFIVSVTGGGGLQFVHLPDVQELFMTPQMIIDRRLEQERAIVQQRQHQRQPDRSPSRGPIIER
ncbi:MAG: hypothetical protein HQL43_06880 [Alphaproteobacteria bacterium]|nr:hypothetical protein [Alphaproteobacteria bacterium]